MAEPPDNSDAVDRLIAVQLELTKLADARRGRVDAIGTTLMTTAGALIGALVAAAKALDDPGPLAGPEGYVVLTGLTGALVFSGIARATGLQRLNRGDPPTADLWERERMLVAAIASMAATAGERRSVDPVGAQLAALRLWQTKAAIGARSNRFRNYFLSLAGLSLMVAAGALVVICVIVLGDA